jgi:hypothetical protein
VTVMSLDSSEFSKSSPSEKGTEERAPFRIEATPVAMGLASHLCLVGTPSTGGEIAFRGGPSKQGAVSPSVTPVPEPDNFGPIRMDVAPYKKGFIDYDPKAPSSKVDLRGQKPDDVLKCFRKVAEKIHKKEVPYYPASQNSNSAVFTMLEQCGCTAKLPKISPGFGKDLLKDDK